MPTRQLQQQLDDLRQQLSDTRQPLGHEDQAALLALMADIELRLASERAHSAEASLIDGVNLAVERFEVSHPTLAGSLRAIMQTLANMGI
jgi:hypothetical protein